MYDIEDTLAHSEVSCLATVAKLQHSLGPHLLSSLQFSPRRLVLQKILHLKPRVIRKQGRVRPFSIPSPLLLQLRRQFAFQHLNNVLAEYGEELPAVEVATCCDKEILCTSVRRNDEVAGLRECVPV